MVSFHDKFRAFGVVYIGTPSAMLSAHVFPNDGKLDVNKGHRILLDTSLDFRTLGMPPAESVDMLMI